MKSLGRALRHAIAGRLARHPETGRGPGGRGAGAGVWNVAREFVNPCPKPNPRESASREAVSKGVRGKGECCQQEHEGSEHAASEPRSSHYPQMAVSARMGDFGGKARGAGVAARQILSPRLLFPTNGQTANNANIAA